MEAGSDMGGLVQSGIEECQARSWNQDFFLGGGGSTCRLQYEPSVNSGEMLQASNVWRIENMRAEEKTQNNFNERERSSTTCWRRLYPLQF
jgi:hypothetical protein